MENRTHRRELDRAAARRQETEDRGLLDAPGTPLARLVAIAEQRDRLAELELAAVMQLRAVSTPWSVIGRALGITGQAASKRYGRLS